MRENCCIFQCGNESYYHDGLRGNMKDFIIKHKRIVIVGILVIAAAIPLSMFIVRQQTRARSDASVALGDHFLSELNYEQAIASYTQALDIDPKNIAASYGLAEAYEASEMFTYAEAVYQNILEEDNTQNEAYEKLAELYLQQNKTEEAKELLQEAEDKADSERLQQLIQMANPAAPVADYASGAYSQRIRVTLSTEDNGAIFYTTDGSQPDSSSTVYSEPLILPNGMTDLKAVSINSAGFASEIAQFEYDIQIETVEVQIQDPVIGRLVRDSLGLSWDAPIYNEDIEQVTQIYLVGDYVASTRNEHRIIFEQDQFTLDGWTYTPSYYNSVSTLDDLRSMPFLERVVIAYMSGMDISALGDCNSITELSLMCNGLTDNDAMVLSQMSQLEYLCLGWNELTNLSYLSGLTSLSSLGIWGNQITDISPVSGLTGLNYLDFSDNRVTDITAVAGLNKLQSLWMYHNQISDISAVTGLENLQVLMLQDNPISNPDPVRSIYPHLTRVDEDLLGLGTDIE